MSTWTVQLRKAFSEEDVEKRRAPASYERMLLRAFIVSVRSTLSEENNRNMALTSTHWCSGLSSASSKWDTKERMR